MCNLFAWMATLGILSFMKKWGNFENSFTRFMNKKSWGLYIFHYLPLTACAWYLSLYAKNMPVLLHYIVVGISSFVGAFILYELISRIPMNLGFPPKGKHVFGIVKVGDKGQIVIPAKARKIFNITAGDNLIVLGDEEQGIALIKEDGFLKLLQEARDKS